MIGIEPTTVGLTRSVPITLSSARVTVTTTPAGAENTISEVMEYTFIAGTSQNPVSQSKHTSVGIIRGFHTFSAESAQRVPITINQLDGDDVVVRADVQTNTRFIPLRGEHSVALENNQWRSDREGGGGGT